LTGKDQEWEISEKVGEKVIDNEIYYLINWKPTLVPKRALRKLEFSWQIQSKHRRVKIKGQTIYLVRWKPTYEPRSSLVNVLA
jgi:hypothetical protein